MTKISKNKRNHAVDVYRGISIIAIVLLHFESGIFSSMLNIFIGSFMINAFYFTSGWICGSSEKTISTKELIKKRLITLGRPYLYFSLIILCFDLLLLLLGYYDFTFLGRELYKTLTLRGIGTLWFLPALFFSEIIFNYLKNKGVKFIILSIIIAIFYKYIYSQWSLEYRDISNLMKIIDAPFRTIFNIANGLIVYTLGYYLSILGKRINLKDFHRFILMVCLLGTYIFILHNNIFQIPVLKIAINASLLLGMFILSYFLSKSILNRFFVFFGTNSLIVMVTHYSFIQVIFEILHKEVFNYATFSGIYTIMYFLITLALEYPLIVFMNNNSKARYVLGKTQ